MLRLVHVCAAIALCGLAAPAAAQQANADRGKDLFEQGKRSMQAKKYDEACAQFEQSYEVGGVAGSLLNWADCEETRGKLARALKLWRTGLDAVAAVPERKDFVERRIEALAVRVPRLDLRAPRVAGLVVTVDGMEVVMSGDQVPVDPGKHVVVGTVPGHPSKTQAVEIEPGQTLIVTLFEELGSSALAAPKATDGLPPIAIAGWAVGAVGVGGLIGFGVTAGLVLDACHGVLDPCGGAEGRDADQVRALNVANGVTLGIGVAGVVTGAALLIAHATSGASADVASVVRPWANGSSAGLEVRF